MNLENIENLDKYVFAAILFAIAVAAVLNNAVYTEDDMVYVEEDMVNQLDLEIGEDQTPMMVLKEINEDNCTFDYVYGFDRGRIDFSKFENSLVVDKPENKTYGFCRDLGTGETVLCSD